MSGLRQELEREPVNWKTSGWLATVCYFAPLFAISGLLWLLVFFIARVKCGW